MLGGAAAMCRAVAPEYHFYPQAGHTEERDVDRAGSESTLKSFLVGKRAPACGLARVTALEAHSPIIAGTKTVS